jgi:hypothetical protein
LGRWYQRINSGGRRLSAQSHQRGHSYGSKYQTSLSALSTGTCLLASETQQLWCLIIEQMQLSAAAAICSLAIPPIAAATAVAPAVFSGSFHCLFAPTPERPGVVRVIISRAYKAAVSAWRICSSLDNTVAIP